MKTITRKKRTFLDDALIINTWEDVQSYYEALLQRSIDSKDSLLQWMADRSETDAALDEEYRWRYIRQTCDTEDETHKQVYENFIEHIMPKWMSVTNQLNKKLAEDPHLAELDQQRFFVYLRQLKTQLQIFREENIPLAQQTQLKAQEYGSIIGAMTIEHEGQEYTLPQAAKLLQHQDRTLRKTIFEKTAARRLQDRDKLNQLYSELLQIRHQIAKNAGFDNYRDYMFAELGRFDYDVAACEQFHEAIKSEVIPLVKTIHQRRRGQMNVDSLYPYDLDVDPKNLPALQPFTTQEELIEKSIDCLNTADDFFGECIGTMQAMEYLDLSSRKGKAPGGYNMTLPEIGVPFIFMNAAGTQRDVETMLHEAGHAVHSFLMRDLPFNFDMEINSETAELASMSMELMTFEGLKAFYSKEDQQRAMQTHLEGIITMLPWIALIDKFQHWIYTHPEHTAEERELKWAEFYDELSSGEVSWQGYEDLKRCLWHKQLHLFEVPFYYIEYGIAQLGAIAVWRNFKRHPHQAIKAYKEALRLGATQTIPHIYQTAGIEFNFSADYVRELMDFLRGELPA